MRPCRTNVTVSKPRCGCCGKPGTMLAVVHAPAVDAGEVLAEVAAVERRRRADVLVASGYASTWWTQNRNGSIVGHWKPRC